MNDRAARGGGTASSINPSWVMSGSGNTPADWFGPGTPPRPVAPPEVSGRAFDIKPAFNLQLKPRQLDGVPFESLRNLVRAYDILRIVIETRKDQMAALKWKIVPRDGKAPTEEQAKRIAAITEFFRRPDKKHDWATWLRMIIEDMLVVDAAAIYRRLNLRGEIHSYRPIDGTTIKPVLDPWGDTPNPPGAAYQQVLRGLPAVNYTSRQLLYLPRNVVTYQPWGISPVEQIITIVSIGLQREAWQLSYFTQGNLPDSLISVPDTWTGDQIRKFQEWFDGAMSGNIGRRSGGAIFIPGGSANPVHEVRGTELFGAAEEWLARVVCFAFGLSPQAFVAMMNRATSETAKESSTEDGLEPHKNWVKCWMDDILCDDWESHDLEYLWAEDDDTDPKVAEDITDQQTKSARLTINEARVRMGEDPYPIPEADEPMIWTSNGYVPLDPVKRLEQAKAMFEATQPAVMPGQAPGGKPAANDDDEEGKKPPAKKPAAKFEARTFGKAEEVPSEDPIPQDRALCRRAEKAIARAVAATLSDCADDVAAQVEKALNAATKAAGDIDVDQLVADLDLSTLDAMTPDIAEELMKIATDTGRLALVQVGADTFEGLVDQVNDAAVAFARARAAELVGKRYDADGNLIDNPNPRWAITDTTRTMLRELIAKGLEDNIGTPAIADSIQQSAAFGKVRANIIAATEVANANEQSKLIGWRGAESVGVAVKKKWLTAGTNVCPICLGNQGQGFIALNADFQSGDDAPPGHPNCRCVLISEV